MDLQLYSPFTMLVCGPSGSGKSVFTRKLLSSDVIDESSPRRVVWCYGVWQPMFENDNNRIEYHQGLPTEELLSQGNMTLVIDDLMQTAKSSSIVSDIFTKYSHHHNITCICLMQNIFPKGSEMRNISLNANYIALMKNTRDAAQIGHLARQMYPGNSKFLVQAYEDATKEPYSYLLLDFCNQTPKDGRIRTGILDGETAFAYTTI